MRGDVYLDRNGEEWSIQRKVIMRNGKVLFLYRLKKIDSVFETKWFTNDKLWAFILNAKWERKNNGKPICYSDVSSDRDGYGGNE